MPARSKPNGSTRRRRTQAERREETSGKLLSATIALLREKGYSRFRIADAAAKAKVSRGGQTHHFATKNDLVEAAIERLWEREVSHAQVEAAKTEKSAIFRHAAQHAEDFFYGTLFQVTLNLVISLGASEHLASRVRAIAAKSRAPMEEAWIEKLVQSGVCHEKAETMMVLLAGVIRGHVVEDHIGGDPGGLEPDIDFAIGLLNEYLASAARIS